MTDFRWDRVLGELTGPASRRNVVDPRLASVQIRAAARAGFRCAEFLHAERWNKLAESRTIGNVAEIRAKACL